MLCYGTLDDSCRFEPRLSRAATFSPLSLVSRWWTQCLVLGGEVKDWKNSNWDNKVRNTPVSVTVSNDRLRDVTCSPGKRTGSQDPASWKASTMDLDIRAALTDSEVRSPLPATYTTKDKFDYFQPCIQVGARSFQFHLHSSTQGKRVTTSSPAFRSVPALQSSTQGKRVTTFSPAFRSVHGPFTCTPVPKETVWLRSARIHVRVSSFHLWYPRNRFDCFRSCIQVSLRPWSIHLQYAIYKKRLIAFDPALK